MDKLPIVSPPSNLSGFKTCSKCKIVKAIDSFYSKHRKPGERQSHCKACMAVAVRNRYRADPKAGAAKQREWRKNNLERSKACQKTRYLRDIEKSRAKGRAWHAKYRAKRKAYRLANADLIKKKNAEYRAKHKAEISTYGKSYYRLNKDACRHRIIASQRAKPDKYRMIGKAVKHRRRARLISNGPIERFTDLEIFERDNWTCHLCGRPVDRELKHPEPLSASLDHIKPIARGGGHTRANAACAHLVCNLSKNAHYERRTA